PPVAPPLRRRTVLAAALGAPWIRARAEEPAVEVAAGAWMLPGVRGGLERANAGRVGNAGFIVGRTGVLVIDTGVSFRHGQARLESIAQVTRQPVRQVVLTQARQEFIFGATAYQARGVPVHMHRDAAALMARRCETCL